MEFLRSLLRRNFAGKPMIASRNVGCFLRLTLPTIHLVYPPPPLPKYLISLEPTVRILEQWLCNTF